MSTPQESLTWLRGLSNKTATENCHLLHEVAVRGWTYAMQAAETAQDLARQLAEAQRRLADAIDARPRARSTDPETSKAAVPKNLTRNREALLIVLRDCGPVTDLQLHFAYEGAVRMGHAPAQSPSGLRTRRCELTRMGLAREAGETIIYGKPRKLWMAV